ncbi:hypothetical protein C2E23DRAFT_880942 [Lenzites betulinus]|nr:hypothetical protein C2E23DRAFT_880942 [Lenzites betulinus]
MFMVRRKSAAFLAFYFLGTHGRDIVVDDTDSSLVYSPPDQWSQGADCQVCAIHPDPSDALDGTWHDTTSTGTQPRSIQFSFTGIAVEVFNILSGPVTSDNSAVTAHVDLTFTLDEGAPTGFVYDPSEGSTFQYNVQVFSATNLANTSHTLVIQAREGVSSVILFDYIKYTVPDPPAQLTTVVSSTSTTSTTSTSSSSSSTTSRSSASSTSTSSTHAASTVTSSSAPATSDSTRSTQTTLSSSSLTSSATPSQTVQSALPQGTLRTSTETESVLVTATPVEASSSTDTIPTGAVIGGAVGGSVLLLILLAALLYVLCKRRAAYRTMRNSFESAEGDKPLASLHHELMDNRHRPSLGRWMSTAPVASQMETTSDADDVMPISSSVLVIGSSHPHALVSPRSSSRSSVSDALAGGALRSSSYHSTSSGLEGSEKSMPSAGSEDHLLPTDAQDDMEVPPRDPSVRAHMTRLGLSGLGEDYELSDAPPRYDEASGR